jgi:hypothetical protein
VEKTGYIEIKIDGSKGNLELSPDNYDIREIIAILENAENLLFPNDKKERPTISYKIEQGSVRHIFKTSIQYIIGFNAVIGQVSQSKNIDFLDLPTAKAIENIQVVASKKGYSFSISTSMANSNVVRIDKTTNFYRAENVFADAEFYLYGKVTNAGGKERANIHIYTEELGTVRIETPIEFLEEYENNLLYKTFGIRAIGKQHSETGEIDKTSLKFLALIDYEQSYDEKYLTSLREKAKKSWLGKIDADKWLREIRGSYDA